MLKRTSKNFRKEFILEFTKEIIRSTEAYKKTKIKKEVKIVLQKKPTLYSYDSSRRDMKKVIKEIINKKEQKDYETVSHLKKENPFKDFFGAEKFKRKINIHPILRIPEPELPLTVQYLRPSPGPRLIDIGKINPLLKDPLVRIIECNGPNEKIIVMGAMGRKTTKVTLNEQEINDIIKKFSEVSKIPIQEGVFKVVIGRFILSAIVSEVIGSKFIIKKISSSPAPFIRE